MSLTRYVAPEKPFKKTSGSDVVLPKIRRNALLAFAVASLIGCAPSPFVGFETEHRHPVNDEAAITADSTPLLMIRKDIDLVRLEGVMGSEQQVAEISASVADVFGADMLINDLQVDESLPDAEWLESVISTAQTMRDVSDFSLVAGRGQLLVGGKVDSESIATQISTMVSELAGVSLAVSTALDFPEAVVTPLAPVAPVVATATPAPAVADLPEPGLAVDVVPLAALEQQAVAVQQSSLQAIPALAVALESESVVVVPASAQIEQLDSDGDGVMDQADQCVSRAGYPVNEQGCQMLDGYVKDVRFYGHIDRLSDAARESLDGVATTMLDYPASKIAVVSYSRAGSPTEMRVQARKRGFLVVDYLVAQGVDKSRLQSFALGSGQGPADRILIKEVD